MYEYIVTSFVTELRNEIEYFYNQPWTVSKIPDPKDTDPERHAILAMIPHYLMKAFNRMAERRLPRGSPAIITSREMEEELMSREIVRKEVPGWVKRMPRLEKTLVIPTDDGEVPDEESKSERFWEMNTIAHELFVLFVWGAKSWQMPPKASMIHPIHTNYIYNCEHLLQQSHNPWYHKFRRWEGRGNISQLCQREHAVSHI